MSDEQFNELTGRIDGVARVLMNLIADLEVREVLNGQRFCQSVRNTAEGRAALAEHETSVRVMQQIASQLDTSRRNRSLAHQTESHSSRN